MATDAVDPDDFIFGRDDFAPPIAPILLHVTVGASENVTSLPLDESAVIDVSVQDSALIPPLENHFNADEQSEPKAIKKPEHDSFYVTDAEVKAETSDIAQLESLPNTKANELDIDSRSEVYARASTPPLTNEVDAMNKEGQSYDKVDLVQRIDLEAKVMNSDSIGKLFVEAFAMTVLS